MPKGRVHNKAVRAGNRPPGGNLLASRPDGWELYLYRESESRKGERWANLKLIHPQGVKGKANYWLAYCLTRADFAKTRDNLALETNDLELMAWVEKSVMDHFSEPDEGEDESADLEGLL